MGRYAYKDDVLDRLKGVNLDAWVDSQFGGSTPDRDRIFEQRLVEAENWVESYTQRSFPPLARYTDVVSGKGSVSLRLQNRPIFDVLRIDIRFDPLSSGQQFGPEALRLDRDLGHLTIRPNFAVQGAYVTGGPAMQYRYVFPTGVANIVVQYRTAYAQIGDNVSLQVLADESWSRVAAVSTDEDHAYFDCSEHFGPFKPTTSVSERPPLKMLKNGEDDSANWTMVTSSRLRAPIGDYDPTARYVFVYVPSAVSQAASLMAAVKLLEEKGTKSSGASAGGAISLKAGPFAESYGDFQYSGQVNAFKAEAVELLRSYKAVSIV